MYSRLIDGDEYTFGVSGKLIRNVLVMYDRQTGTLWSQLLGEAVEGELAGTKLDFLPSVMTTWEDWKSQHPGTLALRTGGADGDPYYGYYQSGAAGVIGETFQDERLYTKEFIIGVEHQGEAVAFPFSALNDEPVVNYQVGALEIVVVFNADTGAGVVYERQVDGQTLTFSSHTGLSIIDEETGTVWEFSTGEGLEGPLAGATLVPVKNTSSFWFGWKDFYPETAIYGLDEPG